MTFLKAWSSLVGRQAGRQAGRGDRLFMMYR